MSAPTEVVGMDDRVKTGAAGEGPARKRTYEPPQVLRLEARGKAAGAPGCFGNGSGAEFGCSGGSSALGACSDGHNVLS